MAESGIERPIPALATESLRPCLAGAATWPGRGADADHVPPTTAETAEDVLGRFAPTRNEPTPGELARTAAA